MQSLPTEIILEIFKYLPADDLLELTATCKVYRELIAGSKLVKKLELKFRKLNGDKSTLGDRQYSRLRVGFIRKQLHYELLDRIGRELTAVTFRNNKLKIDTIRAALVLCPSITELTFDNSWLTDVPKILKRPFPVLSGVKLSAVNSDPRVFRILRDCSVVELEICLTSTFFNDFTDTKQFLLGQSSIENLSLHGFYRTNFFEDNTLDKVKFQLKSFTLKQATFLRTDHLKRFLKGQMTSLERLHVAGIDNCDLSDILNQSASLRSLKISLMALNYLEPMTSVTELDITCHKTCNLEVFRKFPCLKHLRLSRVGQEAISKAISENFQTLESLELDGGSACDIMLKKLKKLTLKSTPEPPLHGLLINLEELIVERCYFVDDEYLKSIKRLMTRLRILTIVDCGSIKYDRIYFNENKCRADLNK